MIYFTGVSSASVEAVAQSEGLGLMLQPFTNHEHRVRGHPFYAADNGCFSHPERFALDRYLCWLRRLPEPARCIFATAPDRVGDAAETLRLSLPVLPQIRALGLGAAFIAQNGLTPAETPWGEFDALFIGGDNHFKLGQAARVLVSEARRRGLWVHMGRVNSLLRLQAAQVLGCHSADGTQLMFGPDVNLPRVLRWCRQTRRQPALELWR